MKFLIVGSGTAGLISAIMLKKFFINDSVDIVYSSKNEIIGVGEGSTEHFKQFIDFVGIKEKDLILHCGATFKAGVFFKDWYYKKFFHCVQYPFAIEKDGTPYVYINQFKSESDYLNSKYLELNRINSYFINNIDSESPTNQFHFDTYKLNDFLKNFAINLGINIVEDTIIKTIKNNFDEIHFVVGEKKKYFYDFYIDATGFKRVIMSSFENKWISFNEYLKMNSAITFQTGDEYNYNLWTLSQSMSSGWMFKIPVWGRHGNGYIYDKNYLKEDEAVVEVEKFYNKNINVGKTFSFDPGYLERCWVKNCLSIGLSSSFVEPLEASSIGTTIQQIFMFFKYFTKKYDDKTISLYNHEFIKLMNNIRDFIYIHYLNTKNSNNFWIDVSHTPPPSDLKEKLDYWKFNIPSYENFKDYGEFYLFGPKNFLLLLNSNGIFNAENIYIEDKLKYEANKIIENEKNKEILFNLISHKNLIKEIKKIYS